ncbi:MAG: hypothetical protein AAFX57_19800, partial [Bacteroidota bacterium]
YAEPCEASPHLCQDSFLKVTQLSFIKAILIHISSEPRFIGEWPALFANEHPSFLEILQIVQPG